MWPIKTKSKTSSLGLNHKNTVRLRGRIRAALMRRRFFEYLVTVRPAFLIALFAPLLGIASALKLIGNGMPDSTQGVLALVSILLAVALSSLQIGLINRRFNRISHRLVRISN